MLKTRAGFRMYIGQWLYIMNKTEFHSGKQTIVNHYVRYHETHLRSWICHGIPPFLRHKSLDGKLNNPARLYLLTGHFANSVFPNFSSLPGFSTDLLLVISMNIHCESPFWSYCVYKMGKEPI